MAIVVELSNRLVEGIFLGFVACFALGIIEEKSVIGYSLYVIYIFVSGLSSVLNRLFRLKMYRHFWLELNLSAEL